LLSKTNPQKHAAHEQERGEVYDTWTTRIAKLEHKNTKTFTGTIQGIVRQKKR
jgi:hypothetical protein